jgi:hypothetical protein
LLYLVDFPDIGGGARRARYHLYRLAFLSRRGILS